MYVLGISSMYHMIHRYYNVLDISSMHHMIHRYYNVLGISSMYHMIHRYYNVLDISSMYHMIHRYYNVLDISSMHHMMCHMMCHMIYRYYVQPLLLTDCARRLYSSLSCGSLLTYLTLSSRSQYDYNHPQLNRYQLVTLSSINTHRLPSRTVSPSCFHHDLFLSVKLSQLRLLLMPSTQ